MVLSALVLATLCAATPTIDDTTKSLEARTVAKVLESKKLWRHIGDRDEWTPGIWNYFLDDLSDTSHVSKPELRVGDDLLWRTEKLLIDGDLRAGVIRRGHWQWKGEGGTNFTIIVRVFGDETRAKKQQENQIEVVKMMGGASTTKRGITIAAFPETTFAFAGTLHVEVSHLGKFDGKLAKIAAAFVTTYQKEWKVVQKEAKKEESAAAGDER